MSNFITRIKLKLRRKLQELKLHVIARYYPEAGRLAILCIGTSEARAHDSPQFRRIFDSDVVNNGIMFGDAAYGCEDGRKLLVENGVIPVLKYKGDDYERTPYGDLCKAARGVIETVFGAGRSDYGSRIRQRDKETREAAGLCMGLSHNIRSYFLSHETQLGVTRLRRSSQKRKYLF